jgi:hypothetical protein
MVVRVCGGRAGSGGGGFALAGLSGDMSRELSMQARNPNLTRIL